MNRQKGVRNAEYAAKRKEMATKIRGRLADRENPASLREIATAAEVSLATIQHYFKDREGVIVGVLEETRKEADLPLRVGAQPSGSFGQSIKDYVNFTVIGFRNLELTDIHALGLAEGLNHPNIGEAYLLHLLEPTLEALATRLAAHQERGEMIENVEVRYAAMSLLSPLLVAALHQYALGGNKIHRLEMDEFAKVHTEAFVRAYGK